MDRYDLASLKAQTPTYMRLSTLASRLGVTPEMLEQEAAAGRMQMAVVRLGRGQIRHVRVADAARVLQQHEGGTHAPNTNYR